MERWSGKIAVVTGASAGIGAGVVLALLKADVVVIGLARRAELIEVGDILVVFYQYLTAKCYFHHQRAGIEKVGGRLTSAQLACVQMRPLRSAIDQAGIRLDRKPVPSGQHSDQQCWRCQVGSF